MEVDEAGFKSMHLYTKLPLVCPTNEIITRGWLIDHFYRLNLTLTPNL